MRRSVNLTLALLASFFIFWFWPGDRTEQVNGSHPATDAAPLAATSEAAPTAVSSQPAQAKPDAEGSVSNADALATDARLNDLGEQGDANEGVAAGTTEPADASDMQAQLATIMQSYAEISRFPPHSQPLQGEEHIAAFINAFTPQIDTPFPLDDGSATVRLGLELGAYHYFPGDRIEGRMSLSGLPPGASVTVNASLRNTQGAALADAQAFELAGPTAGAQKDFAVLVESADYSAAGWPHEMQLAVTVAVNGERLFASVPMRFNQSTAEIRGLGYSQPVAESLHIPVAIDVTSAGYYHLAAILYSGDAARPLLFLETEGRLGTGANTLTLRAHIQALKHVADEGPYVLSDIRLTRWADESVPFDQAVAGDDEVFIVEGYAFSAYEDVPYIDPMQAERQRLMEGLGQL